MTCYARKVEYAAHDGEGGSWYGSMIEFTRKNGCRDGIIVRRVLYQMIFDHNSGIHTFSICEIPTVGSIENHWIGGKDFVDWKGGQWSKTGSWLHSIASGGWYQCFTLGAWVKVGRQRRRVRRAKMPNMVIETRGEIKGIRAEIIDLEIEINGIDDEDFISDDLAQRREELSKRLVERRAELSVMEVRLLNVIDELRFTYTRKLGVPYWSRSTETLLVESPKLHKKRRRLAKVLIW